MRNGGSKVQHCTVLYSYEGTVQYYIVHGVVLYCTLHAGVWDTFHNHMCLQNAASLHDLGGVANLLLLRTVI